MVNCGVCAKVCITLIDLNESTILAPTITPTLNLTYYDLPSRHARR